MPGRRVKKCRFLNFRMCLSLYDYQSKASRYSNGSTYLKTIWVTTNQKTYNRFTKTKKKGTSIIQKKIIKPQKEKQKERNKEKIQNQLENKVKNGNKYIPINNYLKCQWTKCCNQKIQSGRLD